MLPRRAGTLVRRPKSAWRSVFHRDPSRNGVEFVIQPDSNGAVVISEPRHGNCRASRDSRRAERRRGQRADGTEVEVLVLELSGQRASGRPFKATADRISGMAAVTVQRVGVVARIERKLAV